MFRIGEFSKIAQVSGRQLRNYDRLGLLTPEYTDPDTGYRYYTVQQLPRLNKILALKELGLSLAQIDRLLNEDISAEEIRGMLTLKKSQVEQILLEEARRFRYIETRIAQIDREGDFSDYDLVLKSVPAQRFLSLRDTFPHLGAVQLLGADMHRLLPAATDNRTMGHFMVIIHSETWEDEELDMEVGFIVPDDFPETVVPRDIGKMQVREVAAVPDMLTIVRTGVPSMGHGFYGATGLWMTANGYQIADRGREVYYRFAFPGREHESVAEIQFPVEKITPHTLSLP